MKLITRRNFLQSTALLASVFATSNLPYADDAAKPNIVLIYTDDLGYGDVSCYGATKVNTPNIDWLAQKGVRFTNAHTTSATCTPSRYSLLTGEYAWRQKGTGILPGNAKMIIEPGRTTMPSILQKAGYTTGVVGKWHLGLGDENMDWNKDVRPGPLDIGFDYSFLIPATGDRVPCVYTENGKVMGLDPNDPIQVSFGTPIGDEPTGKDHPELLKMHPSHGHNQTIINGISRIGYMTGGKSARWVDEDMADVITEKATAFIERNKENPFFLYFSTHDIHVPRVPHSRFAGKSGLGPRGDVILQMDWCVGEIEKSLQEHGLLENTLIIFTSDNGPVVDDGYEDEAVTKLNGHTPSGPLRGGKYSAFDAGTRVPFIVRWDGKMNPGISDALFSQIDLMATFAELTEQSLPEDSAPDSLNALPTLLNQNQTGRDYVIEQAGTLSIIQGDWKYIEPSNRAKYNKNVDIELGNDTIPQLYNLKNDLGEKNNLAEEHPKKVKELSALLDSIRNVGKSR